MGKYPGLRRFLRKITLPIMLVICFGAVGCDVAENVAEVFSSPDPEIVGAEAEFFAKDADYQADVLCTVRNNGDPGNITVKASLTSGGFWSKREVVHLDRDASRQLVFNFKGPNFPWEQLLGVLMPSGNTKLERSEYTCEAEAGGSIEQNDSSVSVERSSTTNQKSQKTVPPTLNVPGKVDPEDVAGKFVSVSDRRESDELVVVTIKNSSKVATHYHITGDDSGRNGYGWRIINHNGVRCSAISEKPKVQRGGDGTCRLKDIYPGEEVQVHYIVRSPDNGSASITWILTASHTCGVFGCREKEVDRISKTFSVSNR